MWGKCILALKKFPERRQKGNQMNEAERALFHVKQLT